MDGRRRTHETENHCSSLSLSLAFVRSFFLSRGITVRAHVPLPLASSYRGKENALDEITIKKSIIRFVDLHRLRNTHEGDYQLRREESRRALRGRRRAVHSRSHSRGDSEVL